MKAFSATILAAAVALVGNAATVTVSQGKSDATGKFSVDGGEAVTFDGKIVLPDAAKHVDISLAEQAERRGARSFGNYHDRTDDALELHGMFTNETVDAASSLPDPSAFVRDVPRPIWDGHDDAVKCFAHCFKVTGRDYLRSPEPGSGFTRNFVYTPFGSKVFLWGTCFITMYGRYASHVFPFASMLDNFYGAQHRDGWIPRSISILDGTTGDKGDLSTSGCNMTGWTEWRNWEWSGDRARLEKVYPSLLAFHRWMRENRTWKDGTYFCNGLGCGMDNIVRFDTSKYSLYNHHAYFSWLDVTLQEAVNARFLLRIAKVLGTSEGVAELETEVARLGEIANSRMWDEESGLYKDLDREGRRIACSHIGAFWALLAGFADERKIDKLERAAFDKRRFYAACGIASTSMDDSGFRPDGGNYWQGGSWCITDSMVVKGFESVGRLETAHRIARHSVEGVAKVFADTGYVWESYNPTSVSPGKMSKGENVRRFVGFSGTVPVMLFVENVLGIRMERGEDGSAHLVWDIRLLERHGIENLVLADGTRVNLLCEARSVANEKPVLRMTSTRPVKIKIIFLSGELLTEIGK